MRAVSAEECEAAADRLARDGHAVIPGVIDAPAIRRAQAVVRERVAANAGRYTGFSGAQGMEEVFAERLGETPAFRALCQRLHARLTDAAADPETPVVQFVRCFTGRDDRRHALDFHFDSYALSLLIPVLLPEGASRGDLLLVPNLRPFRRSYAANVLDKALYANPLSQAVLRGLYRRRSRAIRRVPLTPGDLHVFSGYRTLHTNESCAPDEIRSTAVFFYDNPHRRSWKGAPAAA